MYHHLIPYHSTTALALGVHSETLLLAICKTTERPVEGQYKSSVTAGHFTVTLHSEPQTPLSPLHNTRDCVP